ncbi:MAG: HAMP domain-containing protein [Spirochaetes bacterium]|nr:MAG: HAMP domain-containing protein [Spirochaetota bacterium]
MTWFNNLKVSYKVMLASGIFLLIIIGIALMGINEQAETAKRFDKFFTMEFEPIGHLNKIMNNILQIRVDMQMELAAAEKGNMAEVEKRIKSSQELTKEYADFWELYKQRLFSDEGRKLASEWEAIRNDAAENRKKFQAAAADKQVALAERFLQEWLVGYRALRNKTDEMLKSKTRFAQQDVAEQAQSSRRALVLSLLLMGFSILVSIIVTTILARAVSNPVRKGLEFAKKIAEGDLTDRIDLYQRDELGQLATALNVSAESLEKFVSEVLVASQNLSQAVEQIASGNQNLSQRTSEQASSLEEIASTIEEATATIRQNAENSEQANKLSRETMRMAEEGNAVVVDAVASINEVNKSSKKIEEIISVINEIAFQTNLLALNAAVEAARAGEQGRGFAVVAGEVRNLAQRSGNAAKEIGALIKESMDKIETGTDLANRSGDAIREIVNSMKNVARLVSEIAAANQEQKQGIDQINVAVSEMDTMTQQNAALVEETASASEEMAGQAKEMQAMVERFNISDTTRDKTFSTKHKEVHLKAAEAGRKKVPLKGAGGGDGKGRKPEDAGAAQERRKQAEAKALPADVRVVKDTLRDEGFEEF